MLGCSTVPAEPCLEYTGDCSLLPTMYSVEKGFTIPDDYTCQQFPAGARRRVCGGPRSAVSALHRLLQPAHTVPAPPPPSHAEDNAFHTFLLGLILAGVAIPFKVVVEELLSQANEPERPENQLSWPLTYKLLMGGQHWHFDESKPGRVTILASRFANEKIKARFSPGPAPCGGRLLLSSLCGRRCPGLA